MKILNSFRAVIENSATSKQKVIVWATLVVPMLIVVIVFGSNLK